MYRKHLAVNDTPATAPTVIHQLGSTVVYCPTTYDPGRNARSFASTTGTIASAPARIRSSTSPPAAEASATPRTAAARTSVLTLNLQMSSAGMVIYLSAKDLFSAGEGGSSQNARTL